MTEHHYLVEIVGVRQKVADKTTTFHEEVLAENEILARSLAEQQFQAFAKYSPVRRRLVEQSGIPTHRFMAKDAVRID